MSNLKIPGLIQGKKEDWEKNLSETEIKNESLKYAQAQQYKSQKDKVDAIHAAMNNNGISIPNSMTMEYELTLEQAKAMFPNIDGTYNHIGDQINSQKPYTSRQKFPYDEGLKKEMMDYLNGLAKKPKSAFEELIEALFTTAEKEQLIIDMGYILEQDEKGQTKIMRKLSDGTVKTITNSLDELFLKEITVKFKNLLLAKATLKLKL